MGIIEILVVVFCVVFVSLVIAYDIYSKKKHKGNKCSGCSDCPYNKNCKK